MLSSPCVGLETVSSILGNRLLLPLDSLLGIYVSLLWLPTIFFSSCNPSNYHFVNILSLVTWVPHFGFRCHSPPLYSFPLHLFSRNKLCNRTWPGLIECGHFNLPLRPAVRMLQIAIAVAKMLVLTYFVRMPVIAAHGKVTWTCSLQNQEIIWLGSCHHFSSCS